MEFFKSIVTFFLQLTQQILVWTRDPEEAAIIGQIITGLFGE